MKLWRKHEDRTLAQPTLQPLISFWPIDGSSVTPVSAMASPNVYAAVRCLADAAASCPLVTYRRTGDTGRRRASGQTAELLRVPAEGVTQSSLISTVMSHLLLWGNSYVGKFRDENGRVEQLLPIAPDKVQIERRAGRIRFTVTEGGRQSEHGLDDIIHVKALSTDGLVGLSPIRQMRQALDLDSAVREASTALFKNHARPSGILSMTHRVNADQAALVKEQWNAGHAGERAGGIAVVTGEISFTPIGMPADDAEFCEARKLSATEVARCFRIPPWMLGAEGGGTMTYSNVESQSLAFAQFSLRPWLIAIEQAFSSDRDLFTSNLFCEFLLDSILRADSKTRAEIYSLALDPLQGWMTRAEVRARENLEPEPEGNPQLPTMSTNGQGALIT